jgi:hypothetical protein
LENGTSSAHHVTAEGLSVVRENETELTKGHKNGSIYSVGAMNASWLGSVSTAASAAAPAARCSSKRPAA